MGLGTWGGGEGVEEAGRAGVDKAVVGGVVAF